MPSILLVADDAWVQNQVRSALSADNDRVVVSEDPKAVVDLASESPFDIAIIDLQVQSMGGMAVTRALRDAVAGGDVSPLRIILLLDRSADIFLAKRAGVDAHLVKPFTAQDLRRVIGPDDGLS
jgi:DNA-binding response OmpR family regulator